MITITEITKKILQDIELESIAGFIFDCDGTLVDSMPLHNQIWERILQEHGVPHTYPLAVALAGTPDREIVRKLNQQYQVDLDPENVAEQKFSLTVEHVDKIQPIEAIVNIARQYHGILPQAVVSGGERLIVEKSLQNHHLEHLFDFIVCADTPTKPKPSADIFLYAAQQLGVEPSQCHVFEDGDGGIEGALKAGMSVTDVRLYL